MRKFVGDLIWFFLEPSVREKVGEDYIKSLRKRYEGTWMEQLKPGLHMWLAEMVPPLVKNIALDPIELKVNELMVMIKESKRV